jgi:hypothetical protein
LKPLFLCNQIWKFVVNGEKKSYLSDRNRLILLKNKPVCITETFRIPRKLLGDLEKAIANETEFHRIYMQNLVQKFENDHRQLLNKIKQKLPSILNKSRSVYGGNPNIFRRSATDFPK